MKICEDCIKQDVCKFKEQVEGYENKIDLPNPLEPIILCKYKHILPTYPPVSCPSVWTSETYSAPWIYTLPETTTAGDDTCTFTCDTFN